MEKVRLSFSSLSLIHEHPHCWLNKMMGITQPENKYMTAGKEAHKIIQAHVSNKHRDSRLNYIEYAFPVVEEKNFDERCGFTFTLKPTSSAKKDLFSKELTVTSGVYLSKLSKEYEIRGFYDGLDIENGRLLEIKTPEWAMSKFATSYQRKLYALSNRKFTEAVLITGTGDTTRWGIEPPKVYTVPMTAQDRADARDWILKGISILESGDLQTDLVDGKCVDYRCYWGENCQFK